MNDEKFVIIKYIKEFIMMLDDYTILFPRRFFELRNALVMNSNKLLERVYDANYTDIENRKPIQLECLKMVNLIDFNIEHAFERKILSEKQVIKLSKKLENINKMLYKWIQNG